MSVNNNPNIAPSDNPFADLSSLKTAELNERETSILSKCNYKNLKTEWTEGLNNISNNAHTHMRNVKEVKESFFCHLGNVLGFVNSEPLKEVNKVFSNFDLFDRYVRNDIPQETYKKIAKTNQAYFDKVIEHLEDSAKKLDIKADARIGTFCSSSTGYALANAATRFRDTADYLKRMMNGDNAAKPGNNNANPGTDRGQPTIINHYHNNIGHIGDINIGHLGDNNFYNKGNMAVMFKGKSNGVPHAGFRPEYSVSKTENLFYSPTINGMKLLELEAEDAVKLLGPGDKNKERQLEIQPNAEVVVKGNKPITSEKNDNLEPETIIEKHTGNFKEYTKPALKLKQTKKPEVENTNAVPPENDPPKRILDEIKDLRDTYYRLWDKIHQNKTTETKPADGTQSSIKGKLKIFDKEKWSKIESSDDTFTQLEKLGEQIAELNKKLSNREQKDNMVHHSFGNVTGFLGGIIEMIGNDKETFLQKEKNKSNKLRDDIKVTYEKMDGLRGVEKAAFSTNKKLSEQEQNMKPDEARKHLIGRTKTLLEEINRQLETLKKN